MKVEFVCDSCANIHSAREEIIDTEDYGLTGDEWLALSEDEQYEIVEGWANERLEIYWQEV